MTLSYPSNALGNIIIQYYYYLLLSAAEQLVNTLQAGLYGVYVVQKCVIYMHAYIPATHLLGFLCTSM